MAIRSELRARAQTRADQVEIDSTWSVFYNYWIDEAAREVWVDLIKAGWPADFTTATVTANGSPTYTIGTGLGILAVVGVYYNTGGQYTELRRVNPAKVAQLRSSTTAGNYAEFYEVRSNISSGVIIELFPAPAAGSYRVDYIPEFTGFANDNATWYGPLRTDELIVIRAAYKALMKENGASAETRELDREYKELLDKILCSQTLDFRNPAQIRDVATQAPRNAFDYPVAGSDW